MLNVHWESGCTLNLRERGDVTVIDSSGTLTMAGGSASLRDIIRDLIKQGKVKILLNLAETTYVDSTGIGEFVSGFTNVTRGGGQLKLLALGGRVKDLLIITKLYTVFETFDNEDEAVASFTRN